MFGNRECPSGRVFTGGALTSRATYLSFFPSLPLYIYPSLAATSTTSNTASNTSSVCQALFIPSPPMLEHLKRRNHPPPFASLPPVS